MCECLKIDESRWNDRRGRGVVRIKKVGRRKTTFIPTLTPRLSLQYYVLAVREGKAKGREDEGL
jgi:hypothetical protein